jgi:hypothetical protein
MAGCELLRNPGPADLPHAVATYVSDAGKRTASAADFPEKVAFDFRRRKDHGSGTQNIYQRLASFILEFLYHSEYFDAKTSRLRLPVNRFDIADYLGTAPESAARAFARLEHEGLVKRQTSRTLEILDLDGLLEMQRGRRRGRNRPTSVDE